MLFVWQQRRSPPLAVGCGAVACGNMGDRSGNGASGRVAQLVERAPEKREVTGSMPVPTTNNFLVSNVEPLRGSP